MRPLTASSPWLMPVGSGSLPAAVDRLRLTTWLVIAPRPLCISIPIFCCSIHDSRTCAQRAIHGSDRVRAADQDQPLRVLVIDQPRPLSSLFTKLVRVRLRLKRIERFLRSVADAEHFSERDESLVGDQALLLKVFQRKLLIAADEIELMPFRIARQLD